VVFDSARDGRYLAMNWDTRILVRVRAPGETEERDVSWLANTAQPIISPDGRSIAFSNQSEPAGPNYDVMLRGTDGSSPYRLGDGFPVQFSRDGKWVLSYVDSKPRRFFLYPRGPGQAEPLGAGALEQVNSASLFPDGRSAVVCGYEPGKEFRCYFQDLAGKTQRMLSPVVYESAWTRPVGRSAIVEGPRAHEYSVLSLDAPSESRPLPNDPRESFAGWSADGESVFFVRLDELPVPVERYELKTGRRTALVRITPGDRRGVVGVLSLSVAEDSYSYVYQYERSLGVLYEIEPAKRR
jgi:dipeptidyl aminopeptidase/acylaminoacyl peptidase